MKNHTLVLIFISTILALLSNPAKAERDLASKSITTEMSKRANRICSSVLPAWIKSQSGMRDKSVRRLVADCYLAQARLPLIGTKTETLNTAVTLNEVPSTLLEKVLGLHFDAYAPIAGVEIRVHQTNNLRGTTNE